MIEGKAKRAGVTVSEYCRHQALSGRILAAPKLTQREVEFFRTLKEHNHGFVRITNLIRDRNPRLTAAIEEHLDSSRELFKYFC